MFQMIHQFFHFLSFWSPWLFCSWLVSSWGLLLNDVLELPFPIILEVFSYVEPSISWIPYFLFIGLVIFEAHNLQYLPEKICRGDKHFAYLKWLTLRLHGWLIWVRKSKLKTIFLRILKVLFHCLLIFKFPFFPFFFLYAPLWTLGLSLFPVFFICVFFSLFALVSGDCDYLCIYVSGRPKVGWQYSAWVESAKK